MKAARYIAREFIGLLFIVLIADFITQYLFSKPISLPDTLLRVVIISAVASVGRWLIWGIGEE